MLYRSDQKKGYYVRDHSDMPQDSKIFILKQPLWKKVLILLIFVQFVVMGASLVAVGEYVVGVACLVLFGGGGIFLLARSRTVLIADNTGINLIFGSPSKIGTKIPWAMIKRIEVVSQTTTIIDTMTSTNKVLALYLNDPNFLLASAPAITKVLKEGSDLVQKAGMVISSDAGTAQAYIPSAMLPGWSVEKIAEQLNAIRTANTDQFVKPVSPPSAESTTATLPESLPKPVSNKNTYVKNKILVVSFITLLLAAAYGLLFSSQHNFLAQDQPGLQKVVPTTPQSTESFTSPAPNLTSPIEHTQTEPVNPPKTATTSEVKKKPPSKSAVSTEKSYTLTTLNELASRETKVGSEIVTGYIWRTLADSPKYSSVILPAWGLLSDPDFMEKMYTIDIWDGSKFVFYTKTAVLQEVVFPAGGVDQFRVAGISTDYSICPGTHGSYLWGVKFAQDGTFHGERLSIVVDKSSEGRICKP